MTCRCAFARAQALKEHRPELLERVEAEEAAKKKRAEVSSLLGMNDQWLFGMSDH